MATKEPLFAGECEFGQLIKIFKVLGTPDDTTWPGVQDLQDYNPEFPKFRGTDLAKLVPVDPRTNQPVLCEDGIDLLKSMLVYDPGRRISARRALEHPYFHDMFPPTRQAQPTTANPSRSNAQFQQQANNGASKRY